MEVYFANTYDESNLFLLEIPEQVYEEYIIHDEGQLIIKGTDPTVICTNNKSYELKFLETSNTLMILDSKTEPDSKKEISLMAYHTVVCDDFSPKKYQVYNKLKANSALNYNLATGESNFNSFPSKYSKEDCFQMSNLPKQQFEEFLNQHLIFNQEGLMCIFNESFANNIVSSILKAIALINQDAFESIDEIFSVLQKSTNEYDKVILNLSNEEKNILLLYVFDFKQEKKGQGVSYNLSLKKSLLFISKIVFFTSNNSSGQFTVYSYISLLQMCLNISLPLQTLNSLVEDSETYLQTSSCQDNLFEYYKEYDFRYLIGHCVLYINKNSKDLLIKWIDVPSLAEKFEDRITELFQIKEKWTSKEMNLFMSDLEISNLHERVSRITQIVSEGNPFNNDKQISYLYMKRNPFFKK